MFRNRIPSTYPTPNLVVRRDGNPKIRRYQFKSCISPDAAFAHHSDTSAVKRVITNFDIMALVFEHFATGTRNLVGHSTQERMELRGFMLTSKAFFHHAAKALWGAHMDTHGLRHLLNILDLCPISERVSRPNTPELAERANDAFVRGIRRHICWNHFLYYASLIKSLLLNSSTLQPGCIAVITSLIPDHSPLLCSLRQLYWEESGRGEELLFLVGGSLEVLTIGIVDPREGHMVREAFAEWVDRLCGRLVQLAPSLKLFQITGGRPFAEHESPIRYFHGLHKTPAYVYDKDGEKKKHQVQRHQWEALEEVVIHSNVGATTILAALDSIQMFVSEAFLSVELHSELAAWPYEPMQFLWLTEPLLNLSHLIYVDVTLPNYLLAFTAKDLLAITKALPAVEILHLSTDALFFYPNIPTFSTIGQCLQHCLRLAVLSFPIVCGPQSPSDRLTIPGPLRPRLSALCIGKVRLNSNLSLATAQNMMLEALLNTFPRMTPQRISLGSSGWIGDIEDDGPSSDIEDGAEDPDAPQ
ncbi:hypothetical protein ACG7TL_007556 [Trametes sanguinea]